VSVLKISFPDPEEHFARGRWPLLDQLGSLADRERVELFVVGGFVRDQFLDRPTKDLDFTVCGDAIEFGRTAARNLNLGSPVIFERFGTVRIPYSGGELDFVSARAEQYEPFSRKPEVIGAGIREDLTRRDFTINALAIRLNSERFGELLDLFNGLGDLKARLLRTPLDPVTTFSDDPLRILRAIRFASQLQFSIDPAALHAIGSVVERLAIISQERITDELLKILCSPKPSVGLRLMYLTGVMDVVFPEISLLSGVEQIGLHHHKDVFDHTLQVVDNIAAFTDDPELRLAALTHDIAKPRTKRFVPDIGWTFHGHEDVGSRMMKRIGRKLRLPEATTERISKIVALHMRPINLTQDEVTDSGIRRFIVDAGEDLEALLTLCRADITSAKPNRVKRYLSQFEQLQQRIAEVTEKDQLRAFQSPVRGEEIMQICNIPPGKLVGQIKHALEEAILEGLVANEHEPVLAYLYQIKDQYLQSSN
jgi:putative nucleotidyltransferase with HDIG domain